MRYRYCSLAPGESELSRNRNKTFLGLEYEVKSSKYIVGGGVVAWWLWESCRKT